jgi:hypothetical protein
VHITSQYSHIPLAQRCVQGITPERAPHNKKYFITKPIYFFSSMFCLLGDNVTWEEYALAAFHYSSVCAIIYGVYRMIGDGRKERRQEAE